MTLLEALKASDIEVAELYVDGYTLVVGSDEENGGYDVSFKVGDMPPYTTDHADTIEQAEQIIAATSLPYTLGSAEWEPREGE